MCYIKPAAVFSAHRLS